MKQLALAFFCSISLCAAQGEYPVNASLESRTAYESRMQWWKNARFGLFLHWGLYAIPAGEWKGAADYGEWIRSSAQIPIEEYDRFVDQFNPVRFNADEWVRLAREAGVKYITITTKHHDGFCLFNSRFTDFDVMSTPFKRDIMKELSDAGRREGIRLCWYYSIMDWHHPDYLPRRSWENDRSAAGADYDRYLHYMRGQLRELLTQYGPIGVLWFDGEWESTWNRQRGRELYDYVRGLQPDIIINNRVGAGRSGMEGFSEGEASAGDFGTPEQQIPDAGVPGAYWETCMTMNDHWGYNSHDRNWKSTRELLRMLADIVSKGGNFLLNVGPKADGSIPREAIDRLQAMGRWLAVNGESIYGTDPSPFRHLGWGRSTRRALEGKTRLYLHVFEWPGDGQLMVPGISNSPAHAFLLSDPDRISLRVTRREDALVIAVPHEAPDSSNSIVVLDVDGEPDIDDPPIITAETSIFVDSLAVTISSSRKHIELRYTLDGTSPTMRSPLVHRTVSLTATSTLKTRCFRNGVPVSEISQAGYDRVVPRPAAGGIAPNHGLAYRYFEGEWDSIPDFSALGPKKSGVCGGFDLGVRSRAEDFALEFSGYILIPRDGVYRLYDSSDDGSRCFIDDTLLVNNDGLHGMHEERGAIALGAGFHEMRVTFFQKKGDMGLEVSYSGPGIARRALTPDLLYH